MSKCLQFYVFLFLSIILLSCSHQPQELKTAEQLIEIAPDSALHILRGLSPDTYKSGANRALYGLLMIRTLDKKMLPLKPDSLLDFSIGWYQKHSNPDRLATCYLYKGRVYKYAFQYEKAMNFYLKSLDEAQNSKDNILFGRINSDLGDIYNIQGDFVVARQKYQIAYGYFSKSNFHLLAFYSLLNIGRTYHEAKEFLKANEYYNKILLIAKDSIQKGALLQEIGLNFYDFHSYDSALYYYREIIYYPYIEFNRSIRYCNLAKVYFDLKQFDSAFYYASNSFKFDIDFRTQRECYRIMTNCEFVKGNTQKVTTYMNKYVALGDSLRKVEAQIKGSYMETMHSTKKEAIQNKYQVWYLRALILLVVIGFSVLVIFIIRRTKKEKIQIHEIHTGEKADMRKRVIVNKRIVLKQKIEEKKAEILSDKKGLSLHEREKQIKKIYEDLLHIDDTKFFFGEMDIVLNNLVTKLKNRYKGLNDKQLMWCCLYLLKISNQDMLILLDYQTDNSLKTLKHRLPKKFKLDNATLLGDFLIGILSED